MGEEDACHEGEVRHELVAVHDDVGVAENDHHLLIQWPNRIRTGNEPDLCLLISRKMPVLFPIESEVSLDECVHEPGDGRNDLLHALAPLAAAQEQDLV